MTMKRVHNKYKVPTWQSLVLLSMFFCFLYACTERTLQVNSISVGLGYQSPDSTTNAAVLMVLAYTSDTVHQSGRCDMEHANWSVGWTSRAGHVKKGTLAAAELRGLWETTNGSLYKAKSILDQLVRPNAAAYLRRPDQACILRGQALLARLGTHHHLLYGGGIC